MTRQSFQLAFLCLVLVAGCGGGAVDLSGQVTLDGAPLTGVQVQLLKSKGEGKGRTRTNHVTTTDSNGNYSFSKVLTGEYYAEIKRESLDPKVKMISSSDFDSESAKQLTFEVTKGTTTKNFELTSRKRSPPKESVPTFGPLQRAGLDCAYRIEGEMIALVITNNSQDFTDARVTLEWRQDGGIPKKDEHSWEVWKKGQTNTVYLPRAQRPSKLRFRFGAKKENGGSLSMGHAIPDPPK